MTISEIVKSAIVNSSESVEVPSGWASVRLEDVVAASKERREPSEFGDVQYVGLEHIESGSGLIIGIGDVSEVKSTKSFFRAGDVLYGKLRPYLKKVCRPTHDGVCSTDILVYPEALGLDNGYLLKFLLQDSTAEFANQNSSGINLPRISAKKLGEMEFPLPPKVEQTRIVTAIESLQQRSARARALLTEVEPLIKNLRQSILQSAFSGRLTADWRAKNPDVEPADQLLERIRNERRQRWEMDQLASFEAKGKEPTKNWKDKYKEPEPVDSSVLPELPEGWCWATAEDVCTNVFLGLTSKVDYVESGGVPLVRAGDISSGTLSFEKSRNISEEQHKKLTKYRRARRGDVLVSKSGSLGTCALVDTDKEFSIYESTISMQPDLEIVSSAFLLWCIRSPLTQMRMLGRTVGSTVGHLNLKEFRTLALPIAPIVEQSEIVNISGSALDKLVTIESVVSSKTASLVQLDQSILAKAFRGKLVTQDPNDEPASELLARICTDREAEKSKKKKISSKKNAKKKISKKPK